jgi:hypothetical protein
MRKVIHGCVSPETAHVVPDYPYGRTLRCKMRWWIETATKGSSKGEQRVMKQTSNPKKIDLMRPEMLFWNKPKASTYSLLKVIFIDEEDNGYTKSDGLGLHSWWYAIMAFKVAYEKQLDDDQKKRLAFIENNSRVGSSYKKEWAAFDEGALGHVLTDDNLTKAFELGGQFAKS